MVRAPQADSTSTRLIQDVVGNKADAAVTTVGTTASILAYVKGLVGSVSGSAGLDTWPASAAPANGVSMAEVLGAIYDALTGAAGIPTWPASAAPANAVSMAEVLGAIYDALTGTAGIPTWPAAAAPANAVSLAEAVRAIYENQGYRIVTKSVSPTTQGATNLFTATGMVELAIAATVEGAVTSGGTPTLEVGVTGSTDLFVAQIADGTTLAADEIYAGTTAVKGAAFPGFKLLNDASAILTLGGADLTGGTLLFHALWRPISTGATLVAA